MESLLNLALVGGLLCLFAGILAAVFGTIGIMPDDRNQAPDKTVTYSELVDFEMRSLMMQHEHLRVSKLGRLANKMTAIGTAVALLAGGAKLIVWLVHG